MRTPHGRAWTMALQLDPDRGLMFPRHGRTGADRALWPGRVFLKGAGGRGNGGCGGGKSVKVVRGTTGRVLIACDGKRIGM